MTISAHVTKCLDSAALNIFSILPASRWSGATPRFIGRGRRAPPAWPARSNPAPSTAIASAWKTTRANPRRRSTAPWCGTAAIARKVAKAPETEAAKKAETVLEQAAGETGSPGNVHVDVCKRPAQHVVPNNFTAVLGLILIDYSDD